MNSYRITLKMDGDTILFYLRADNCSQAVGKALLNFKDSEENIISLCQDVLSGALIDRENDVLIYESEDFKLECSRNTIIIPDKIDEEEPFYQEMEYIHKNLPPHLANESCGYDVGEVLLFRDEYMEQNCFYLDEDGEETDYGDEDETQYFHLEEAAEYIRKNIQENFRNDDDPEISLTFIIEVLKTAAEYSHTLDQVLKKDNDIISVIDITGISSN